MTDRHAWVGLIDFEIIALLARMQRESPVLLVDTEDSKAWEPTQADLDAMVAKISAIEEPRPTKQRKSKGERKRERWHLK